MEHAKKNGFTLIELIVTLTIAAIVAAMAAPSFSSLIRESRMTGEVNQLLAFINFTRSESITRGVPVTLCRSNDKSSCSGGWGDGWISFVDENADGSIDADDEVLKVREIASSELDIDYNNLKDRVTYTSDGLAYTYNGKFTFCDNRGDRYKKGVILSNTGRARSANSSDTLEDCP